MVKKKEVSIIPQSAEGWTLACLSVAIEQMAIYKVGKSRWKRMTDTQKAWHIARCSKHVETRTRRLEVAILADGTVKMQGKIIGEVAAPETLH